MRWHLDKVEKQTKKRPPQLDVPPIPYELQYLWGYFQRLHRKRTMGVASPNPLSDDAILAWQRRWRVHLDPFENECIDELDEVYLASLDAAPTRAAENVE